MDWLNFDVHFNGMALHLRKREVNILCPVMRMDAIQIALNSGRHSSCRRMTQIMNDDYCQSAWTSCFCLIAIILLMYDDGNVVLQWFSADYRI